MRIANTPGQHLAYCLNVHPGETWEQNLESIRTHALEVRNTVCAASPFGLGMRLGAAAAAELSQEQTMAAFLQLLADEDMYVFTINGFPYGPFHGTSVKQDVYSPDWRDPARLEYSCRLADILVRLVPEGVTGSISTVPCSYKAWIGDEVAVRRCAENLARVACHMHEIEQSTGRHLELCLEPEPDCLLETSEETVDFFTGPLLDHGAQLVDRQVGCGPDAATSIVRSHIGVCLDTCHMAIQFERPSDALARFTANGIRVSKIQLSAALEVTPDDEARAQLAPFDEPVYLHQVKARDAAGAVSGFPDLPVALSATNRDAATTWRIHFHVPLYWEGTGSLQSTHDGLDADFFSAARSANIGHLEIETYTFDVLPEELRQCGVADSIAREYEWVLPRIRDAV